MFKKIKKFFTKDKLVDKYYLVKSQPKYYGLCGVVYSKEVLDVDFNDSKSIDKLVKDLARLDDYLRVSEEQFNKLKGDTCL